MLVEHAAARYVSQRFAQREVSRSTTRTIRPILLAFARSAGPIPVSQLRRRHVERWLATQTCSLVTLRNRFSVVRTFIGWCANQRLIKIDPCQGLHPPRQPRSIPRGLTSSDVHSLLLACPDTRAEVIVLLMAQEALRCCEVAALQVGDIDRLDWIARVVGKGRHERFVPVSTQTRDTIERYLGEYPTSSGPLVRSYVHPTDGLTAHTISGLVGRVFKTAGVKERARDGRSAHALRHTALQHILDNGATIEQVRAIAGHAHLSSTSIYLKRFHAADGLRSVMEGREY